MGGFYLTLCATLSVMTLFRMRYTVAGAHTHIDVFAGGGTGTLAHCGTLVMLNHEWAAFRAGIERTIGTRHGIGHEIEFVEVP